MQYHKRNDEMAQLGLTHQTTQQPELSNWQISEFIINQRQAISFLIKNKAGEGYAALYLNDHGGVISHNVYLHHSCELQQIVNDAKRLKATTVFVAWHRNRCRTFLKDKVQARLILQLDWALRQRKIKLEDYFEICGRRYTSAMKDHGNLFIR